MSIAGDDCEIELNDVGKTLETNISNAEYITAPMVGIFYSSSTPDIPRYAKVGTF